MIGNAKSTKSDRSISGKPIQIYSFVILIEHLSALSIHASNHDYPDQSMSS